MPPMVFDSSKPLPTPASTATTGATPTGAPSGPPIKLDANGWALVAAGAGIGWAARHAVGAAIGAVAAYVISTQPVFSTVRKALGLA
jgi:hypothetical protein